MRRDLRYTLGGALILLAVPTLFTMFPGLTRNSRHTRELAFVLWAVLAAVMIYASTEQSERLNRFLGHRVRHWDERRFVAGSKAIKLVLANVPDDRLRQQYEFRLYLFDDEADRLIASYDPPGQLSSTQWLPGKGVVGAAYEYNDYRSCVGEHCCDQTFGLTADQQQRYRERGIKVVTGVPLRDRRDECFGVLVASSNTDDEHYILTNAGVEGQYELASTVAHLVLALTRHPGSIAVTNG